MNLSSNEQTPTKATRSRRIVFRKTLVITLAALFIGSSLMYALAVSAAGPPPPAPACQVSTVAQLNTALANPNCKMIQLASGTYDVQLTITRAVTLQGPGGPNPAIIQPSTVSENAPYFSEDAVIAVEGASPVNINNLVVDGSVASASIGPGCTGPAYAGILYQDASGQVSNNLVENYYQQSPSDYGCQGNVGLAIDVESVSGSPSVQINNNMVTNFQKNGITCDGTGTSCNINNNVITPLPAATSNTGDATNGVQVAFGANAAVMNNKISGEECNVGACGSFFNDPTGNNLGNDAAGVLVYQAGSNTNIMNNQISTTDMAIDVYNSPSTIQIQNNHLMNNRYVGMMFEGGTYTAKNNDIGGTGLYAVGVIALSPTGLYGGPADVSSSVTLQGPPSSLGYFTYASGPSTAVIYFHP